MLDFFFFSSSLLDDMDQRKTDLLETQLLVEQLEQREQMLEAQIDMLQVCIQELPSRYRSATDLLVIWESEILRLKRGQHIALLSLPRLTNANLYLCLLVDGER